MFAEKGLVKDVSGSCLSEIYAGYKIAEYRRNCSLLDWIFLGVIKKRSCLLLKESSHDSVESSRYIPCDRSHMPTTEIELNSAAVMALKKTDNAEKRTADARAKSFWVARFWASGRPIIYVSGVIILQFKLKRWIFVSCPKESRNSC